ncbi:MAG TPA: hypothetical protein DCZ03_06795, partial [Gammaproteobacteria bacterium]|nr:hypothetical protein [Gammaproteobacteria bacterium]
MVSKDLEKYYLSFDLNYYDSCKIICSHMKKGRVNELQNKIITHCGMSIPFFNNVFLKEPDAYLFQDWEEVTGIFSEQIHDFQLVLPDRFRQSL